MFAKIMTIQDIGQRNMLSSKKGFSEFCRNNGIDTPGFVIYNGRDDLKAIKETLNFPVINKLDFSWGGTDMFISTTFEEFETNLHKIPENEDVLIQEYIDGEEIHVEALFYQGELMAYFTANILKFSTTKFSYTTQKKYFNDTLLEPILRKIGAALKMNSFGNICFLYDKDRKKHFLIEVDPRPNSWMPYSRFIGENNFIHAVRNIVNGHIRNSYQGMCMKRDKVEVRLFYKDIRRILWQKDFKSLIQWVFNINGYGKYIPLYDKVLMKRILNEVWDEVFMFYIRRITGRKKKTL
jgi:biotin carboxylase